MFIDTGILITAAVGMVTSVVSGWTSYFFTRKKYNTEVDHNVINNMKESLEFYTQLSDDTKARLEDTIKRNDELENEVKDLRKQVSALMLMTCNDLTCLIRQRGINLNGESK